MARILVSSDADVPPTVKVSTAKSGVVYGTLAEVQPYEDLNKFSTVDRYLYEVPITSEESFMMVVVTEEIGAKSNVVQASVKLLSCEGTTVIVPLQKLMNLQQEYLIPRFRLVMLLQLMQQNQNSYL
jgi:hypothetical protein